MSEDKGKHQEAQFIHFILSLQSSAWFALGKMANPMTGKVERNLESARATIDLLEVLEAKTKGNLTPDEEKVLASCLGGLRLNYVDESAREKDAKPPDKGDGAPEGGGRPSESGSESGSESEEKTGDQGDAHPPAGA